MNQIIITNITQKDAKAKHLFPQEQPGNPQTYDISVVWQHVNYSCTYPIGSKDGKKRSSVLRLQNGLTAALGNKAGKSLQLKRTGNNQYHLTAITYEQTWL